MKQKNIFFSKLIRFEKRDAKTMIEIELYVYYQYWKIDTKSSDICIINTRIIILIFGAHEILHNLLTLKIH